MRDAIAEQIVKRQEQLAAERAAWEAHWQELADYVLPRRADFTIRRTEGEKRTEKIFDATATYANELLAAALHGFLTNPAAKWFQLRSRNRDLTHSDEVKRWLAQAEDKMLAIFASPRLKFSGHIHELYLDLGAFGTGCMFVGERVGDGLIFRGHHLAEVFVAENAFGMIDTVYRKFQYTARQASQRWGSAKLSAAIGRALQKESDKPFDFIHAVFPREERKAGRLDSRSKPWASIWVDVDGGSVLEERGFDEFPYMVPRWYKTSGETYGRSPAMTVLPDIKMINAMSRTVIKGAQKIVDPPLLVPDDGYLLPVRTVPGGLNFKRPGTEDIQPLITHARVDIGLEMMEQRRQVIRAAFFGSLFQTPESPIKTATQVLHESDEKLRMLGPMLGRLQSELLGPLIERVFNILLRAGQFDSPPQALQGQEVDIEYVSPIANAQKASEAHSLLRWFETMAPFGQIDSSVFDLIDNDEAGRLAANALGVPTRVMRDPATVARLREARSRLLDPQPTKGNASVG